MKRPDIQILRFEDVEREKTRLNTHIQYQKVATEKNINRLKKQLRPENLLANLADRVVARQLPGLQNVWKMTAELRKYYFLKFFDRFLAKNKTK